MPLQKGIISYNFLGSDKEINTFKNNLKLEFDIDIDNDRNTMPDTIKTFISFIAKAEKSLLDEEFNESLINFVIALDLVFGEKGSSTKSVSERVALITFKKFAKNFSEQKKRLEVIYDARSGYVHAGKSVETKLLEEVQNICQEVFFCMLRHRNNLQNKEDVKTWCTTIDFLVKAIEAKQPQPDSKYEEIGIWVK